jgi:hypothetical protein
MDARLIAKKLRSRLNKFGFFPYANKIGKIYFWKKDGKDSPDNNFILSFYPDDNIISHDHMGKDEFNAFCDSAKSIQFVFYKLERKNMIDNMNCVHDCTIRKGINNRIKQEDFDFMIGFFCGRLDRTILG